MQLFDKEQLILPKFTRLFFKDLYVSYKKQNCRLLARQYKISQVDMTIGVAMRCVLLCLIKKISIYNVEWAWIFSLIRQL